MEPRRRRLLVAVQTVRRQGVSASALGFTFPPAGRRIGWLAIVF
jgi:hypothetical protein